MELHLQAAGRLRAERVRDLQPRRRGSRPPRRQELRPVPAPELHRLRRDAVRRNAADGVRQQGVRALRPQGLTRLEEENSFQGLHGGAVVGWRFRKFGSSLPKQPYTPALRLLQGISFMASVVRLAAIEKTYRMGEVEVHALRGVSL